MHQLLAGNGYSNLVNKFLQHNIVSLDTLFWVQEIKVKKSRMGACGTFSKGGQIKGLGTKVPQRWPRDGAPEWPGVKAPEADNRMWNNA